MGFWTRRKDNDNNDDTSTLDESPSLNLKNVEPAQPQNQPVASNNQLLQPGVVMLGISAPMFARAYYLYHHSPLHDVLEKVAARNRVSVQEIKEADIGVRRAAGMAVAGRALKLASLVSFGSFGLLGAVGNSKRKKLDQLLGVEQRVDEDHPEMIARKAMTREEEAEYLAKRYWISKDKPVDNDGDDDKNKES